MNSASRMMAAAFNEAAGIPRGRRIPIDTRVASADPSMRPRVFPAEDGVNPEGRHESGLAFNEAAGIPRGRHASHTLDGQVIPTFNEAAGIPRGRLDKEELVEVLHLAFNEAAGIPRGRLGKAKREINSTANLQ